MSTNVTHKDAIGQPIVVGCTILHGSGGARGNYAGFRPETVIRLTPKRVVIVRHRDETFLDPGNVVVIDLNLKALKAGVVTNVSD